MRKEEQPLVTIPRKGTTCSSLRISSAPLSWITGAFRLHFSPEVLGMDCKARGTIWGITRPSSRKHAQRQGVWVSAETKHSLVQKSMGYIA